jgi:hypothetical protein
MRNRKKKTRHARKMLDRVLFTKKKKEKDTRKIKNKVRLGNKRRRVHAMF